MARKQITFYSSLLTSLTFSIGLLFLTACGPRPEGYGIVRWSPDEGKLPTGTLLEITASSTIQETYTGKSETGIELTLPQWRVEFFAHQQGAENFKENFRKYVNYYAHNLRDRHLIREAPNQSARINYRLRQGQLLKVLEKHSEPLVIGEHEGYWYKVLTEDGFTGYSYDMHLDIFDITQEREIPTDPQLLLVQRALEKDYRPIEFLDMVRENRLDLSRFTPKYGLFPNPEEKYITIITEDHTIAFEYHTIDPISDAVYRFRDSELELEVISERTVRVYYIHQEETFSKHYVVMDNINRIIQTERERRTQLLEDILEIGTLFISSAYGTFTLDQNNRFTWQDNHRLIPDIIPANAGTGGEAAFTHFIGESLRNRYHGVMSLSFEKQPENPVHFLYTKLDQGLRLVHASERNIDKDKTIHRESTSPLVIAFSARQQAEELEED